MKQELMDAIQEMPVIAAVKDDAGLCSALTNENIRVVFVLYGDICNISSIVRRIHEAGRFAVVHIDLIAGLAGKEVAVDFIRNTTEADGIISTRQSFIRRAKELGLAAILRVFLLDSIALESLDKIPANLPDCLDLLPGAMPKILRRVCAKAKVPVLTGRLIVEEFVRMGKDPMAVPAVLCKNHGPFTWGKDAREAVHNAVVLEEVAKMAYRTESINPQVKPAPQELQDKHYYRKHGANAYYGQEKH